MAWKKILALLTIITGLSFAIYYIVKDYTDKDIKNEKDCNAKNPNTLNDGDDCYNWSPCYQKCLEGKYDKTNNTCKPKKRVDIILPILLSLIIGFTFLTLYIGIFE